MEKVIINQKEAQKGITLIALVITIIVLLILAGVSIAMLTGQNGILTQAQNSKTVTENKSAEEKAAFGTDIVKKVKKTVKKNLIKSGTAVSTVFEHELTQDIIDILKSKRKAKLAEIKAGKSSSQTAEGFQKNTSTPAPQTTYNPFAQQQ